jgi:7-cyano-7-deazaguanine tRNA-ribosyltransferase
MSTDKNHQKDSIQSTEGSVGSNRSLKFELLNRDGLARIARLTTEHGNIETPTLLPVINPNDQVITADEMRKMFGTQAVITNSYIIYKSETLRELTMKNGVHGLLDFNGPIMTDSGTFQLYTYGKVAVKPLDIIEFQKQIKPDIGTILDVFGEVDRTFDQASEDVNLTIERAKKAVEYRGNLSLAGTIQGGLYPELRKRCAEELSKLPFDIYPIGGVVPFMEEYLFKDLARIIIASKMGLNPAKPVHLFGAGHPIVFPMAVALGCDTFDSASYIKYADDDRFIFQDGTKKLNQLEVLSCLCPVCVDTTVSELNSLDKADRRKLIAKHNLYICFNELKKIKQAILDNTLWELVEQRARVHPNLLNSLPEIYSKWKYLEKFEPLSRRRFFYVGPESMKRPEVLRFQERILKIYKKPDNKTVVCLPEPGNRTQSFEEHYAEELQKIWGIADAHIVFQTMFGPVPIELSNVYPFGQSVIEPGLAKELAQGKEIISSMEQYSHGIKSEFSIVWTGDQTLEDLEALARAKNKFEIDPARIRAIADYQFGSGAADSLIIGRLEFVKSKNTGKIRNIISEGEHILSLRARDGLFTLKKAGAIRLHKTFKKPRMRVSVDSEAAEFNRSGKNVFAKFVKSCDPDLRPGDEVLVTDEDDTLVAVGKLILTCSEMSAFNTGLAVRVREGMK